MPKRNEKWIACFNYNNEINNIVLGEGTTHDLYADEFIKLTKHITDMAVFRKYDMKVWKVTDKLYYIGDEEGCVDCVIIFDVPNIPVNLDL